MSNPYAGLTVELTKREKEIIHLALTGLLNVTKYMDRKPSGDTSKEWDKIDSLRDRFITGEED